MLWYTQMKQKWKQNRLKTGVNLNVLNLRKLNKILNDNGDKLGLNTKSKWIYFWTNSNVLYTDNRLIVSQSQ